MRLRSTSMVMLCFASCLAGLPSSETVAQRQERLAYTDPENTDEDFPLQGEYYGPTNYQRMFGVQVVAEGNGKFSARLYEGGLPGLYWYGGTSEKLTGQRDGDLLKLVGDRYIVMVKYPYASVYHRGGSWVGNLEKVTRASSTLGLQPPYGSTVLFDYRMPSDEHLQNAKITQDGYLAGGAITKMNVRDFRLHVEFRTPYMPDSGGQQRGNSGVYIQRRYEVQILDSFGLDPLINGAAALYRQRPAEINMSFAPLVWQTYDIFFRAARWDDNGNKLENARITVEHNGYPVQTDYDITAKTGAGQKEGPEDRPILFQDHRDPVVFRTIWIQRLNEPMRAEAIGPVSGPVMYGMPVGRRRWCRW